MANIRKKFTLKEVKYSASVAGHGGQASPQTSSSCDDSLVEVASLAHTKKAATSHVHDEKNKPDSFCYVCGLFSPSKSRKKINDTVRNAYEYCFASKMLNENVDWVPHIVCSNCYKTLITCHSSKNLSNLKWSSPVVYSMPEKREDCFFCMTVTTGFNSKNKNLIKYTYTSKVKPAIFKEKSSRDKFLDDTATDASEEIFNEDSDIEQKTNDLESSSSNEEFGKRDKAPQKFSQAELSDLGRELGLSKEAHELLASRLKEKNLLHEGTNITVYRNREQALRKFFVQDEKLH